MLLRYRTQIRNVPKHHHHHKHLMLGHLTRSVSKVTVALSIVSSVSQLFSLLVGCSGMILKGFGFVAFFAGVKVSSFCIHLCCLVCSLSVVPGLWTRFFCGHTRCPLPGLNNFSSVASILRLCDVPKQNLYIIPLKIKHRLLYLKTQSVPRCKHFLSRL
jgi:hypothetical protein